MTDRIPPHSEEAERAVIGAMMVDSNRVLDLVRRKKLRKECFYTPVNKLLFETMFELSEEGVPVDIITISERVRANSIIKRMGGASFLNDFIDSVPSAGHAEHYSDIVLEKYKLREIISIAGSSVVAAYYPDADPSELVSDLTTSLVGMNDDVHEINTTTIIDEIERSATGEITNIPLPFQGMTRSTGGIQRGMVTIFTGRGKSGKSMFKSFWMRFLGEQGIPTLDLCFEDGIKISKVRTASSQVFCASDALNGGRYIQVDNEYRWVKTSPEEIQIIRNCMTDVDKLPLYWCDQRCRPSDLMSLVSRYVNKHGIQVVFIDGAKDIIRPGGMYNNTGYDEEISQAMVTIATRLNIAVIPIYHLTKIDPTELIATTNIRGSGNITSDSRSVYALQGTSKDGDSLKKYANAPYFPILEDSEGNVTTRVLECIENNHGRIGKMWLESDLSKCSFWKKI